MPKGRFGQYKWYTLDDLILLKEFIFSEEKDEYLEGISMLINMALLTKEYAEKLNEYERLYEDDGK